MDSLPFVLHIANLHLSIKGGGGLVLQWHCISSQIISSSLSVCKIFHRRYVVCFELSSTRMTLTEVVRGVDVHAALKMLL